MWNAMTRPLFDLPMWLALGIAVFVFVVIVCVAQELARQVTNTAALKSSFRFLDPRDRDSFQRRVRFQQIYDRVEARRQTEPMRAAQTHCPLCAQIDEEDNPKLTRRMRRGAPVLCAHHQRAQAQLDLYLDGLGHFNDYPTEGAA